MVRDVMVCVVYFAYGNYGVKTLEQNAFCRKRKKTHAHTQRVDEWMNTFHYWNLSYDVFLFHMLCVVFAAQRNFLTTVFTSIGNAKTGRKMLGRKWTVHTQFMRAHGHGNSLDSFHDSTQYNADADAWAIITATIKCHTLSLTPAEIWQNVLNA